MEFNYWVLFFFLGIWAVQIVLSILDDTFFLHSKRNLDLPLSQHWGVMVGDPILAVMNGFLFPHLSFSQQIIFLLVISILASWLLHKSWWNIRGHIFPDHEESEWLARDGMGQKFYWHHDITEAGWCHLIFFIFQIELILEYLIAPMSVYAVGLISGFLLVFAPFGVFQPGWAEWRNKRKREPNATWFLRSFLSLLGLWAATLAVYYLKT